MPIEGASGKPNARRYSEAEKERAVRAVRQLRKELGTDHGTIKRVADQLGIGVESLRNWVRQAEIDDGVAPGVSSAEAARIKALEQENTVDSFDNALAETTNGLYKAECVRGPDAPAVWDDVDQLELETLAWVHWFNEHRLHGHCGDVPPAEFESAFYADRHTTPTGAGNPNP